MKNLDRILLRVALTAVFGIAVYWTYMPVMTDRVAHVAATVQESSERSFERLKEREERRMREARDRDAAARAEAASSARAAADAELRRADEEHRKALARERFYVAPPECSDPPTWERQVDCGNRYMRARRAFEAEWARTSGAERLVGTTASSPPETP